jgi:hypothetical protein
VGLADSPQELDTILARHIVVRDHTVKILIGQVIQSFARARHRFDGETVILAFEKGRGNLRKVGVIIDVKETNRTIR